MAELHDDDTTPTEEDGVLDQLRREGILGPFRVVDWSGGSDVGSVRERNEDAWHVVDDRVFLVADGVGGHDGGELAARTAVTTLAENPTPFTEAAAPDLLARANQAIRNAGAAAGIETLGTTVVALAAHRNHVVVMSAGDSRAYRLRDGELEQLTRDHTVRNELLDSGVPLAMAEQSNLRLDALTSSLGRSEEVPAVHAASYSVMSGDRFLLCTDGIHGQVPDDSLLTALGSSDCRAAVVALLEDARQGGGRDNATALVVEFGASQGGDE